MRREEFLTRRKQSRMQNLLHPRQINLRILGVGMVSVHQQRPSRQQEQNSQRLIFFRENEVHSIVATLGGMFARLRFRSATHEATAKAASSTYCGSIGRR